ncbi:unnamed protein product [Ectocarpus sp. 12 AP-2014]
MRSSLHLVISMTSLHIAWQQDKNYVFLVIAWQQDKNYVFLVIGLCSNHVSRVVHEGGLASIQNWPIDLARSDFTRDEKRTDVGMYVVYSSRWVGTGVVAEVDVESTVFGLGGTSILAAGGNVSERVIQREGMWKSDAYKPYTVNNTEDSRMVSRILGDKDKGVEQQTGEGTVWGRHKRRLPSLNE